MNFPQESFVLLNRKIIFLLDLSKELENYSCETCSNKKLRAKLFYTKNNLHLFVKYFRKIHEQDPEV